MRLLRRANSIPSLVLSLLGLSVLAGCGGGGGGSGSTTGLTSIAGQLVSRDGSTANLGGVQFTLLSTGHTVVTHADGSFAFEAAPAGTVALRVLDPLAPARVAAAEIETGDDRGGEGGGADDPAGHDGGDDQGDDVNDDLNDDGDDHDVGDDDFDVPGVASGESIDVRVSIRGGKIEGVDVSRSRDDDCESEVRLERTPTGDDPDASGEASLRSRIGDERLSVEVEHLAPGRGLEAVVACDGVEESIGTRTVSATGEAAWEISTGDGDVLPHGATSAADLAGCEVVIRDATTGLALLHGTLSDVPPSTTEPDDASRGEGEGRLVRTAAGSGEGSVEIRRESDGAALRSRFQVEVEHQTPGLALEVWLESPSSPGSLSTVGPLTVGDFGEGELELDSHDGDAMPFGVTDVAALVGLAVEVRRASDGVAILTGTVPALVSDD